MQPLNSCIVHRTRRSADIDQSWTGCCARRCMQPFNSCIVHRTRLQCRHRSILTGCCARRCIYLSVFGHDPKPLRKARLHLCPGQDLFTASFSRPGTCRAPRLPRSTQMAQCGVDFDNTMPGANLLQQTKLTAKGQHWGIFGVSRADNRRGRWPIRVISKTTKYTIWCLTCYAKGRTCIFNTQKRKSLRKRSKAQAFTTRPQNHRDHCSSLQKQQHSTGRARVNCVPTASNVIKKAKFKANTYLNVGDITQNDKTQSEKGEKLQGSSLLTTA